MKKRIISLILCGLMLVNVPAVFAQGEDTTVSENTVQFQGEEFDRSELSQETIECHYGIIISNSKNRITMVFLRLFQTQFNQSSL
ncbi:MAG TPA: hypothetical protein H9671_02750 [Firmicutes bacterium]|nr:hypothetical protein [Bacillota bacterium]